MAENAVDLDLGNDHSLHFVGYKSDPRTGADVLHKRPNGHPCKGWIAFEGGAWAASFSTPIKTWKVECWEPLTISPSILCRSCGDHGYIRNGKWERA